MVREGWHVQRFFCERHQQRHHRAVQLKTRSTKLGGRCLSCWNGMRNQGLGTLEAMCGVPSVVASRHQQAEHCGRPDRDLYFVQLLILLLRWLTRPRELGARIDA